jgi:hypothetical protein
MGQFVYIYWISVAMDTLSRLIVPRFDPYGLVFRIPPPPFHFVFFPHLEIRIRFSRELCIRVFIVLKTHTEYKQSGL